mgnify:CR=1 FL=1
MYLNESIGGKLRVVSASITFIFFGVGEIGINLVSVFMNYYKWFFLLQGLTFSLSGLCVFYFCESPFYSYKKRTLGHLHHICTYIIDQNFRDSQQRKQAVGKVRHLLGIQGLVETHRLPSYKESSNEYFSDDRELSYFTLPDSSEQ